MSRHRWKGALVRNQYVVVWSPKEQIFCQVFRMGPDFDFFSLVWIMPDGQKVPFLSSKE